MGWDRDTRAYLAVIGTWSVFAGLLTRARIVADAPLPPSHPFVWLTLGAVEDFAVLAVTALLLLPFAAWPRLQRFVFGALAAAFAILQIVRSEAIVFFGDVVRAEDLHGDIPVLVAVRSLGGMPVVLFSIAAVTCVAALLYARRVRRRFDLAQLTPFRVTIAAVLALLASAAFERYMAAAGLARHPLVALFNIERAKVSPVAARVATIRPAEPLTSIRELVPSVPRRRFIDDQYPLAYVPSKQEASYAIPGVKPNIVLFVMESVRAEEVGCYGGNPRGVTPNIDAIAAQGIRFDPVYTAGTYTASAEVGIWYGIPPLPREVLMASRPRVPLSGLPDLLRRAGWNSMLWIHGGESNFYHRDEFYLPRRVQVVDARSFPSSDPATNWGYSDRAMVRHAIEALDRTQEPFATMMLTVTNHHAFDVPRDGDPLLRLRGPVRVRTGGMIQTVHYTDEAFGDFVRTARTRPWFRHTILVILGDHGTTIPPYGHDIRSPHEMFELRQRIPLIIYSPMLRGGRVLHGPFSQIDIMPTLLALCGVPAPWTGMGANLFDPQKGRVVTMWSAHGRILTFANATRIYHAVYGDNGAESATITSESLVDAVNDPLGLRDIAADEQETTAHFRRLANIYMHVYPWLVVNGRAGVPPQ